MMKQIFILCFLMATAIAADDKTVSPADKTTSPDTEEKPEINVKHGDKGWEFSTSDDKYKLQFQSRLQFRYAAPFDSDPLTLNDFEEDQHILKINRARLKIGGNAFRKWLKYYWEYELFSANLLDFRMMVEKFPCLKVKVGQWKAQYNRERMISSGKQQLVDRSLINRAFTIDRQQGVSLFGHLKGEGIADFNYWASVFNGHGRGAKENDDRHLMYMIRGQWNFLGREVKFSGSDSKYNKKPVGLLALGAVTNRSPYTRFSQAGGGQLEGFEDGAPGQYRVNQWMQETAFMFRGFAWQQELHWKQIDDKVNRKITTLIGNYLQFGYFFHYALSWVPKPLELAFRYAIYNPDIDQPQNLQEEFSLDVNWFFHAHLNKLTAEISVFDFQQTVENQRDGFRFRLQWDVSM